MVKVSEEINVKKTRLLELCSNLQDLHTVALRGVSDAISLLQRYRYDLDLDRLQQGEATVPPVSVMLGWLMAVEVQAREQHCSRLQYLQELNDERVTGDNLQGLWTNDFEKLFDLLYDCKEQCKYFQEGSV